MLFRTMNEQERGMIRAFRRLFFRAREAYAPFPATGGLGLHLSWEDDTLTTEITGPDQGAIVRFVVLMRHFMNPKGKIYYHDVWTACQAVAGDVVTPDVAEQVNKLITDMRNGSFPLNYNGRQMTAEEMYEEIANGGFFGDDAAARAYLEGLFEVPAAGALSRFLFVDYSISAFRLMSVLFEVLSRAGAFDQQDSPLGPFLCIYCLGTGGKFTAEEHVFP
jgi:hypothetical protein